MRPVIYPGEKLVQTTFRLNAKQRITARRMGGSKWIREQLDKAENETNIQSRMAGKSDVPLVDEATGG